MVLMLVVMALVLALALALRGLSAIEKETWPFYAKRLLSNPEQILYHRLAKALPEYLVFAQVQVSRVLGVKKGSNFHRWNNRINRLSYDFVVCARDGRVVAAIELDDSSHKAARRATTDAKKDRATASAGVRLIRWSVSALPDESAIRAALGVDQADVSIDRTASGSPETAVHISRHVTYGLSGR